MRLRIGLKGDRRLTERVILEVTAAARRLGLEIANVEVTRKPSTGLKARKSSTGRKARKSSTGRKARKPASRRKPRARR